MSTQEREALSRLAAALAKVLNSPNPAPVAPGSRPAPAVPPNQPETITPAP